MLLRSLNQIALCWNDEVRNGDHCISQSVTSDIIRPLIEFLIVILFSILMFSCFYG